MKVFKSIFLFVIFTCSVLLLPEVNANELSENDNNQNLGGGENGTYSITDPNFNIEDGGAWCLVTFYFNGAVYNSEIADSFSEVYGLNEHLVEFDKELFFYDEEYTLKNWVLENGEIWDFENDVVTGNTNLYAIWEYDTSYYIDFMSYAYPDVIYDYLNMIYYPSSVEQNISKTTKKVTNGEPINVQSAVGTDKFSYEEMLEILEKANIKHYGGCGPIAMIGIMDYFASVLGYTGIMNDPNDSYDRMELGVDVFKEVFTLDFGLTNESKKVATLPSEYCRAFNDLMEDYNISDKISSQNGRNGLSGEQKYEKIKESIDNGVPITCYTILPEGEYGSHYTNIYGYEEWNVVENGVSKIHRFIILQPNNGENNSNMIYYMDADFLNSTNVGLIWYEISGYDNIQTLTANEFCTSFAHDGMNYVTDSSEIVMYNSNLYSFCVRRERVSSINNQLILSANKINCGSAGLYLDFYENIKKLTFDISLFSNNEGFNENSEFVLYYYDNGVECLTPYVFKITELSTETKNITVYFPYGVDAVYFKVLCYNSVSETDKGRVMLDNISIFYNLSEQHYHSYTYTHTSTSHTATCSCGESFTAPHTIRTTLVGGKPVNRCTECGYTANLNNDFVVASVEDEKQF